MNTLKISILGSTGSIGRQALDVVRTFPGRLRVVGLAAGSSWEDLAAQAREFEPQLVGIARQDLAPRLKRELDGLNVRVTSGPDAACEIAAHADAELVVSALVGTAGLLPTWRALERGARVALANKETLVAAGGPVTALARRTGARIIPVDSEHMAIFQCLDGRDPAGVKKLWLTASGGPFLDMPDLDLARVTPKQAVAHPRWSMGPKISVDSATLMNKGLEVIEAVWLFGVGVDRVGVVVHPESIVHSMVEFDDGSYLAQLGPTDMRPVIQYALSWPERWDGPWGRDFDPRRMGPLTFGEPDLERFPCLELAYRAARTGGTMPAVLNAANEQAVERFLDGDICFSHIWHIIENIMAQHNNVPEPDLTAVLEADLWAREAARSWKGGCR